MLRHYRAIAVLLTLIASARIISTYRQLSSTIDEPAHLAAGMELLESGRYTYETQHPPLARLVGALGLHFAGSRWQRHPDMYWEGWHLLGQHGRYWRNLFFARLAMLPFFWIEVAVVFLRAGKIGGAAALCTV